MFTWSTVACLRVGLATGLLLYMEFSIYLALRNGNPIKKEMQGKMFHV